MAEGDHRRVVARVGDQAEFRPREAQTEGGDRPLFRRNDACSDAAVTAAVHAKRRESLAADSRRARPRGFNSYRSERTDTRRLVLAGLAMASIIALALTQVVMAEARPATTATTSFGEGGSNRPVQTLTVTPEAMPPAPPETFRVEGSGVGRWILPVHGGLGDGCGPRPERPVPGVNPFHRAQDIVAPCGKTTRAAVPGTVIEAGWRGSDGNWVLIGHGSGIETGYAHATKIRVRVGQAVAAGQAIATVGSTGASTGCHLHFETHIHGSAVDLVPFMVERGVRLGLEPD